MDVQELKKKERGYDWEAIRDGNTEIVFRYVDAAEVDNFAKEAIADETRLDWIARHVVSHACDVLAERIRRRPLLEKRCVEAIMTLYGSAEKDDLGKA